ncbi:MAG: hypothetical protein ABIS69_04260 [Sediminibacterium sp.]
MHALHNHAGEVIAYHYQNMLVHPDNMQVLGLVLGNCVFDQKAKVLGKLFQQKVYNLSGEVMARKSDTSLPVPADLDPNACILEAWGILVLVKDHLCPWVTPKNTWSQASLAESLYV